MTENLVGGDAEAEIQLADIVMWLYGRRLCGIIKCRWRSGDVR